MKKVLLCVLIVCLSVGVSYGWGPGAHGSIASRMLEQPDIAYLVSYRGLSAASIASSAQSEPPNQSYYSLNTLANLNAYWMVNPLDNTWAGYLVHAITDSSVPTCHSPANSIWCSSCAETYFEVNGEAYSTPAWPSPYYGDRLTPGYDTYCTAFYNEMCSGSGSIVNRFRSHHNSYWACRYFCACMTDWIDPDCRRASLKLGWEVLWWYLNYHS
jgi:hypothetical protein